MDEIDRSNQQFGMKGRVAFKAGPGGLTVAELSHPDGTATVAVHGAHVLTFQPRGAAPVLWVSRQSRFAAGQPIRGGIPVCWPWFGDHPTDPAKAKHGFARLAEWTVRAAGPAPDGATRLELGLTDSPFTRDLWPFAFDVALTVSVNAQLRVSLRVRNTDRQAFTFGAALHTYFHVSDVIRIAIDGLDGCEYLDTVGPVQRKRQQGRITIAEETDRIYLGTAAACTIEDPGLGRRIRVAKTGSHSTVVWNPWIAKAKRMPDFGDDEYPEMLCVETTNAAEDQVTLPPGGEHVLAATLSVEACR